MNDDLTLRFVREHDAACPVCDYNVRGVEATRCPECGAAFSLRLASPDLQLGRFDVAVLDARLPDGDTRALAQSLLELPELPSAERTARLVRATVVTRTEMEFRGEGALSPRDFQLSP